MNCNFCHKEFKGSNGQVICGPDCIKFDDDKYTFVEPNHKYYTAQRRAKMRRGDKIVPLIVFEMYDWKCWLCGGRINSQFRMPHVFAATVDHVRPLSKNGQHIWSNVLPAHNHCNSLKSDQNDYSQ